jgi:3-oxoacyl-[acyl-carrier-protein] synthase II
MSLMRNGRPCISGFGLVTPIGHDLDRFWTALIDGRAGSAPVRSFDTSGLPVHIGCEIHSLALPDSLKAHNLGGRCTELGLAAATRALRDAGLVQGFRGSANAAVVVGTTMGEVTRFEQDRAANPDSEPGPRDVRSLAQRPIDVIGRSIARAHGLGGPVLAIPAACAAGTYAVGIAASLVARGEVSTAVAVGCEAFSRLAFVGFARMRAMSADCCRPFSRDRPGLLLGEGAGALVVESEQTARERGREPMAFVDGFGLSCDAHHVTAPHPQGEGAVRAMRDAIRRAGVGPEQVDYVNAHGTGTPHNDRMESRALRTVFGDRVLDVPVSSIKALTGHMMGAAGAVEAIAALLALRHGTIPPTWNWVERDPECDIDCVPNQARRAKLTRVLSNSYAFGGNNASVLFSAPGA